MKKIEFKNVNLTCVMQQSEVINPEECHTGIITVSPNGTARFEEIIRKGRPPRNPKLYDGKYISMVRMQNGRYQCHLKTMKDGFDKSNFAFQVYSEITNALNIID